MGILSSLFSISTVDKAVDAVIATGDKLVYTDEEKAEMRLSTGNLHIKMLGAYVPFKIAQRVLAMWFSFLYGVAFIIGLSITVFNMISTYRQTIAGVKLEDIITIPLEPLFALMAAFSLGMIVLTIVAFYFAGGTLESWRDKKWDS